MISPPEVLFEDNHIIAVNKKPSEIVQGDKTGDVPLSEIVKDYLKKKYNKPGNVFIGVIHRIDRPVSGVLLLAKTGKALSRLNDDFREKEIQKTYWAIVKNKPPKEEDTLVHYLIKDERTNKSKAFDKEIKGSKRSELYYKVIAKSDNYFLLEIQPKTGRHHQIRVQLSKMGCPIRGDIKYGFDRTNKDASIHLHARKVEFTHPITKTKMVIEAPVPVDNLWKAMENLVN
ncbi:MAG: RluA family pseudouridine synthase [Bacteroidota bacterium]